MCEEDNGIGYVNRKGKEEENKRQTQSQSTKPVFLVWLLLLGWVDWARWLGTGHARGPTACGKRSVTDHYLLVGWLIVCGSRYIRAFSCPKFNSSAAIYWPNTYCLSLILILCAFVLIILFLYELKMDEFSNNNRS